jgi:hypothetical protein
MLSYVVLSYVTYVKMRDSPTGVLSLSMVACNIILTIYRIGFVFRLMGRSQFPQVLFLVARGLFPNSRADSLTRLTSLSLERAS